MIPSGKGYSLILGFLIAFGLVSAALGRFLLPMFQWFLLSSRDAMIVYFVMIAICALAMTLWPVSPGFSWLILAYLFSSYLYGFRGNTLTNTWMLVAAAVILLILVSGWQDHKSIILYALAVGVCINIAVALLQRFSTDLGVPAPAGLVFRDPFFAVARHVREIEGLATHYSLLIALLMIAAPLLIHHFRFGWLTLLPTLYLIYYAGHRSGALCLIPLLVMAPKRWRRIAVVTALIFAVLIIYQRGSFSSGYRDWSLVAWTGDRVTVWVTTAAKATQKPWFGWGPGSFNEWRPTFVHEKTGSGLTYLQAHNEYLQTYFDVGLFGLFSVVIFAVHTAYRLLKARPLTPGVRAGFAAVLNVAITAFGSFPFRIGVTTIVSLVALAAFYGELRHAPAPKQ